MPRALSFDLKSKIQVFVWGAGGQKKLYEVLRLVARPRAAYGPNFLDQWRRAAEIVDKILRGAKPNGIPVEQPTKFDLVINLITAKALGLTVPPSLLSVADEVIE
jgi:hypothetical protein